MFPINSISPLSLIGINLISRSLLQEKLLGHLGVVLYEYLGEEYPEVLGSILGGLKVRICIYIIKLANGFEEMATSLVNMSLHQLTFV